MIIPITRALIPIVGFLTVGVAIVSCDNNPPAPPPVIIAAKNNDNELYRDIAGHEAAVINYILEEFTRLNPENFYRTYKVVERKDGVRVFVDWIDTDINRQTEYFISNDILRQILP